MSWYTHPAFQRSAGADLSRSAKLLSLNGWQKAPKPYREATNKRELSFPDCNTAALSKGAYRGKNLKNDRTGGSAIAAINFIKQHGGKNIKFLCIIAAPEGVRVLHRSHPDVQIYVGHLDRELNEDAYICPGLGDAGDRIFGTR